MITGLACSGSSTPPIPTPPDRWQFSPICAQLPTVAQVSTIVFRPTRAPTLTKLGINTAPGAMNADFRTTAYFEAGKVTDREGKARVHFKLPDNLTTFRLMAVAAGETDFFGAGDAKITTSKKVMARPALPRRLLLSLRPPCCGAGSP